MYTQVWSLKSELWNLNSIALYCLQLCNLSKLLYTSHWPFHIIPSLKLGVNDSWVYTWANMGLLEFIGSFTLSQALDLGSMMLEFTLGPTRGCLSAHLLQTLTNNTSAILSNLCFFIISDPFFSPFQTSNLKDLGQWHLTSHLGPFDCPSTSQTLRLGPMSFNFIFGPKRFLESHVS
jgi:hypothetical protein